MMKTKKCGILQPEPDFDAELSETIIKSYTGLLRAKSDEAFKFFKEAVHEKDETAGVHSEPAANARNACQSEAKR